MHEVQASKRDNVTTPNVADDVTRQEKQRHHTSPEKRSGDTATAAKTEGGPEVRRRSSGDQQQQRHLSAGSGGGGSHITSRACSSLAGGMSSVVAATTASVVADHNTNNAISEQQKYTKQLMDCDQVRVQSIVEDILFEMGEERLVQYKKAFAKFDKDSTGIISSKQLRQLLRTLGHNPSDIELRELVNQVDIDENGKIDFNEFIIMIGYFDKANNEAEDLCDIFRVFERDGERGGIDVSELRKIWEEFLRHAVPVEEFEEMISVIDDDGNGEVDRFELLEILQSTR